MIKKYGHRNRTGHRKSFLFIFSVACSFLWTNFYFEFIPFDQLENKY